jgi:hypothetical protein
VEGLIYANYKEKCKHWIGQGGLTTGVNHDKYIEAAWTSAMKQAFAENSSGSKKKCGIHSDAE